MPGRSLLWAVVLTARRERTNTKKPIRLVIGTHYNDQADNLGVQEFWSQMTNDNRTVNNDKAFNVHCSLFNCHLSFLRPQNALVFLGDGTESFKYETLHALSAIGFSGVDIAFGIGSDAMHSVEFPRLAAAFTERRQDLEGVAVQD